MRSIIKCVTLTFNSKHIHSDNAGLLRTFRNHGPVKKKTKAWIARGLLCRLPFVILTFCSPLCQCPDGVVPKKCCCFLLSYNHIEFSLLT